MGSPGPAALRRERERELVAATRALFDERGTLDAPIEEIAKAVGIARGLIYRQFSSKEELFVLTVTNYLDELEGLLAAAIDADAAPEAVLAARLEAFARFCHRYPAFLDNVLSLMHRPAKDLHDIVSEAIWLRLGQGMAACIDPLVRALRAGADDGTFTTVGDPEYTANVLWTQVLGAMHLARIAVGVKQAAPGIPALFAVDPDDVVATCVASALATAGAPAGAPAVRPPT
ncbi:MAG: transcriptional regulator, TetR family [Solirubrobacterales bacterium]|nr:transcriptional regulator, TetR family [Solirubrobacterales bacterium]